MKEYLYMCILFVFICSCDYYSRYQEIIINNTIDTITITNFIYYDAKRNYKRIDTIVCYPYTKSIFREYSIPEVMPGTYECSCGEKSRYSADRITVKLSSGKILKKDFCNLENWNCWIINDTSKQFFEINEEDLE